ncbi:MAG: hypothetical protein KJ921_16830 [Proteobacteria bacterium]|nr:hypothetical protein [Pseudomonadota bacterium]
MESKEFAKQYALDWLDQNSSSVTDVSDRIWLYAEPILSEHRSVQYMAKVLSDAGYDVEVGTAGLETAFEATCGKGSPVVCTYAEYDNIPGNSQMPIPYPCPVIPGLSQGSYDMHHGLGAGAIGAALAVIKAKEKYDIPGTFKIFGTPAEKTSIGKNVMENAGVFDGLDACVAWHPGEETSSDTFWKRQIRCNNYTCHTFKGMSVYGAMPWGGKNALHAAELMDIAVQFQKESIIPIDHLPNIQSILSKEVMNYAISTVPGIAQVKYISRACFRKDQERIQKKLFDCANAAALAVGLEVNNEVLTGTWEGCPSTTLAKLAYKNIEKIGAPKFTEDEIEYGQLVQNEAGVVLNDKNMTPFGDVRLIPPEEKPFYKTMSTTDTSTLTWKCPTVMIRVNYMHFGWPDWASSSWAITKIAHKSIMTAAKIMTATILDLYQKPNYLNDAKEEHERMVSEVKWYNPMPKGRDIPKGGKMPARHYLDVIEAFKKGPKWKNWEQEINERMERISNSIQEELV